MKRKTLRRPRKAPTQSLFDRFFSPVPSRRASLANILEMLASSAIIGVVIRLAGHSEMTTAEAALLTIGAIWLVILAYILKGD